MFRSISCSWLPVVSVRPPLLSPPSSRIRAFSNDNNQISRRHFTSIPLLLSGVGWIDHAFPVLAFTPPPSGYQLHRDVLDGYEFLVPDTWLDVTSAGNDIAFRDPYHPDQNLFVNVSSPTTSKFSSVKDLGSPMEAGDLILRQYLKEFMSTRIGVVREGEVVSGSERTTTSGDLYYDIEVLLRSFASRSQFAVSGEERQQNVELEFERRLFTAIGVANKRKYELRLQANKDVSPADLDTLQFIARSFRCYRIGENTHSLDHEFDLQGYSTISIFQPRHYRLQSVSFISAPGHMPFPGAIFTSYDRARENSLRISSQIESHLYFCTSTKSH